MREEFEAIRDEFATPRRSTIAPAADGIEDEDLIEHEDMVVTVTLQGYIKRTSLDSFRSEEHTSELQSLMRISYAVFCLKKKKINNKAQIYPEQTNTQQIQ